MLSTSLLDDQNAIAKLDTGNIRGSILALPDQFAEAWKDTSKLALPRSYAGVDKVVVAGMGGSALGAHFIQSVFADRLRLPLIVVNGYTLPAYINRKTLVVLSSYSGETEETLSALREAKLKKARIVGITTGGTLLKRLKASRAPVYHFVPRHNPSGQPRMGLGYAIMGLLGILRAAGALTFSVSEARQGVELLRKELTRWGLDAPLAGNPAKRLAQNLFGKQLLLFGPEFLSGNLHIFANQLNENAKTFASFFVLPELNHHLLEGLKNPKENADYLSCVLFQTPLVHPRVSLRARLTKDILSRQKIAAHEVRFDAPSPFLAALQMLLFGSVASLALALLYKENPSFIPWVDYLKKKLK